MAEKVSVPTMEEAIGATTLEIGTLGKSAENAFGHYNYVPIDKYYEIVPKIAIKHGLVWKCSCTSIKMLGEKHVLYDFNFALFHIPSGDNNVVWQSIPIIHPLQGAQTTGSAMSYAEKLMMRTTFKIVTGEQDADAVDNTQDNIIVATGARPRALPGYGTSGLSAAAHTQQQDDTGFELSAAAAGFTEGLASVRTEELDSMAVDLGGAPAISANKDLTRDEWEVLQSSMLIFIPNHKLLEEAKSYWRANKVLLSNMKDEAPDLYAGLLGAFKDHVAAMPAIN